MFRAESMRVSQHPRRRASAKAEVRFAYPDLAFVGHATFARTKQRWQVSNVRIAPLESVPL